MGRKKHRISQAQLAALQNQIALRWFEVRKRGCERACCVGAQGDDGGMFEHAEAAGIESLRAGAVLFDEKFKGVARRLNRAQRGAPSES